MHVFMWHDTRLDRTTFLIHLFVPCDRTTWFVTLWQHVNKHRRKIEHGGRLLERSWITACIKRENESFFLEEIFISFPSWSWIMKPLTRGGNQTAPMPRLRLQEFTIEPLLTCPQHEPRRENLSQQRRRPACTAWPARCAACYSPIGKYRV